jgi:uncharacterized membrane protein SpoIIM required for sporulation
MPSATEPPREATTLIHWLRRRVPEWRRLAALLARQRDRADESYGEVVELVDRFRSLGRDLSLARAQLPGGSVNQELEALFLKAHEAVYRRPTKFGAQMLELFRDEIPGIVHDMRASIWVTVAMFLGSGLVGWMLVGLNPELVSLFASEAMVEKVQNGKLWTDDLLNIFPSSVLSVQIMANNIIVSLFAFGLGTFYGLGTIYIMCLNGLMLGGVFAFTAQHDMAGRLFNFVVAHGVVELSVICLAGAAGIQLGEALVRPGLKTRLAGFHDAVRRAAKLLPLIVVFLVGAGLIEGYISPDARFPLSVRVAVGVAYGILLWMFLTGRVWRLGQAPEDEPSRIHARGA